MKHNFKSIEKKYQKKWESKKIFVARQGKAKGKKFYVLEMYPYPSGSGLHMGHAFNYIVSDVLARMKRMQGFNVLYPVGYDSLGLPAENAAIKKGIHPKKHTEKAIINFMKQQKELGLSYDWTRLLATHDSGYYKWDQWIFLKMFEKGLAYRKKSSVNYCKKCKTVLANEQVHNGKCWRHPDTSVEIKQLEQWFFKTTKYADELYQGIDKLRNWPERIKSMQKNWIGKSHGTEINFKINNEDWKIFTTRPDTVFGVTFMVVSAQHPKLFDLVTEKQKKQVEKFLKKIKSTSQEDADKLDKEGVFTGAYATNPLTKEKIPVWVGNFVVADYGSGMVMAVPGHDQRDYEFAKKYKLKIKQVVESKVKDFAYEGDGKLVNSPGFNGLDNIKAKEKITKFLLKKKLGKKAVKFKLRDWLVSRQRYWGTPIPIVYCDKCGIVAVDEKDLPVKLPEKVKFGKGNPLETAKSWVNTKCPKCNSKARRETDTMDTFVNSSWYFLRYLDVKNKSKIFDVKKAKYWMPIDQYIGGAEHACMHLIYFRFYTKFLRDLGLLKIDEPTYNLFNQGMLHGKDGYVMSKSRGNVVLPEKISKKYGIDTARLFLMSIATPDKDIAWSDKGIEGSFRFINKVMDYFQEVKIVKNPDARTESKLNKTIIEVTDYISEFKYNLAIIKIRELFNSLPKSISKDVLENSLKLLSVFCPHITEELWGKIRSKGFISLSNWPKFDKKKINLKFEKQDQAVEKIVSDIMNILKIIKARKEKRDKVFVYVIPNEKELYDESEISNRVKKLVRIFAVNDKNKYDPTNKSKNTKPYRPSIYLE